MARIAPLLLLHVWIQRCSTQITALLGRRGVPLVLLTMILALDWTIRRTLPPYGVLGLLDEPAHLATVAIALAAWLRVGKANPVLLVSALASAVAIDIDHLPQVLGWQGLTAGTPRPYTHSAATVVVLATSALLARKQRATAWAAFVGCVIGVSSHLWRDLATGATALWWPMSRQSVAAPYWLYVASLGLVACFCSLRRLELATTAEN
jgi:inner membrane protein